MVVLASWTKPTGVAKKAVTRPLILVSLGRLPPGLWRIQATVKGWSGGNLEAKAPFRITAAKP